MAPKVTFDPANKLIICKSGTTELDAKVDLYSDAKEDWKSDEALNKYRFPLYAVGGNPIDEAGGIYVTSYFFLLYGWRLRPQEANHKLKISGGVLLTLEGEDPVVPTVGEYNVLVQYSQPIKSEATVIETGVSGLTEEESGRLAMIEDVKVETDKIPAMKTETDKIPVVKTETDKIPNIKTETDKIAGIETNAGLIKTETDKIPDIKTNVDAIKTETDKIEEMHVNVLDVLSDVVFIKKVEGGKWEISGDQMIFYDADNQTELMRFDITKDAEGNPVIRTRA